MKDNFTYAPSYLKTGTDIIKKRYEKALGLWQSCVLCPRKCMANRHSGEKGRCGAGDKVVVASYGPHFGEESVLVGRKGSGTIFFVFCNLSCVFCQNWTISRGEERGEIVSADRLAEIMLYLQNNGCHNINLVTPTPYIPPVLNSIALAAEKGLSVPVVYNCGGYEQPDILELLDGIVDIYMPDCKYGDPGIGLKYSGVNDYVQYMKKSLKEMQRQVGDLKVDKKGVAYRGLLVRHLVLPQKLAGTEEVMRFLAEEISPDCAVNIMAQYYPAYRAAEYPPLTKRVTSHEFQDALNTARKAGLRIID